MSRTFFHIMVLLIVFCGIAGGDTSFASPTADAKSCCGANCIYGLLSLLEKPRNLDWILDQPVVREHAPDLSMNDIKQVLKSAGCNVEAVKIEPAKLIQLDYAFIARVEKVPQEPRSLHFVTAWRRSKDEFMVLDYPYLASVSAQQFEKHFTGYALVLAQEACLTGSAPLRPAAGFREVPPKAEPTKGPKLEWVDSPNVAVGNMRRDILMEKPTVVRFKNAGSEDLNIEEVRVSCGCIGASVASRVIPPGKVGELQITFRDRDKGLFDEQIALRTNVKGKEWENVTFTGRIVSESTAVISPGALVFDDIADEDMLRAEVEIVKQAGVVPTTVKVKEIVGFENGVAGTKVSEWKKDRLEKADTCTIDFTLDASKLAAGIHRGKLVVAVENEEFVVPITAKVLRMIESDRPNYLLEEGRTEPIPIILSARGNARMEILEIEVNHPRLHVAFESSGSKPRLTAFVESGAIPEPFETQDMQIHVRGILDRREWNLAIPVTVISPKR